MRLARSVLLVFFFSMLLVGVGYGESLWVDGPSLVEDHRPSKVGDIVTVIVQDKTQAKNEATTDLSKENSISGSDGVGILDF